jgi:methyltransferase (TIGR00027 family)
VKTGGKVAKRQVGKTAMDAAMCRLIEQYQPSGTRLFQDAIVKEMVDPSVRPMMELSGTRNFMMKQIDAVAPGIFGAQICRTRAIDDAVPAALLQAVGQLVILGAGFDTRAYRLAGIDRVKVFEVDLPAVQSDKKKKLQKRFGRLPANVTFIPIDLDQQELAAVLAGTTFDASQPAVFIWEGVTQYITEDAVCGILAFAGKSAPGSILLFTYILKSVIERRSNIPGANRMMDAMAGTAPWIFGIEPANLPAFLSKFHLTLREDIGNADYQERYLKPLGRKEVVFEGERVASASVD